MMLGHLGDCPSRRVTPGPGAACLLAEHALLCQSTNPESSRSFHDLPLTHSPCTGEQGPPSCSGTPVTVQAAASQASLLSLSTLLRPFLPVETPTEALAPEFCFFCLLNDLGASLCGPHGLWHSVSGAAWPPPPLSS